ncbi:type II CRISPR RNA-guided endonuclease Cas9 [Gemella cuniculi]|uniref:type II CRISPR RNA-guided endonuclease Cas9 n=1 Tax=Gemella cuniculi TaxID=150240 RepID=UPI000407991C|nr:type II CRISPR RNA-guided endonuclease Cas9 [Gemella cuniculi]
MESKKWYLGLDIGTASVGWAATDTEYKLLRKNRKRLWGVRLFEEATTAAERRGLRAGRRRLARRKWRLNLLEELFAEEVVKVDKNFFLRLRESKYHFEDKTNKETFTLFNDKKYTDKDFYKEYKTIYHLRKELMTEKNPDIRKVYLAVHHIIKNRGHFLLQGQSFKDGNIDNFIKELLNLEFVKVGFEITDEEIEKIKYISLQKKNLSAKVDDLKKLYPKEKQLHEIFKLIFGGKPTLDKLFNIAEYKELDSDIKSISFKNKIYEEERPKYEDVLSNYIELLDLAKQIYDGIILSDIKKVGQTISESKVESYEKHSEDLDKLKSLIVNDAELSDEKKKEIYYAIFKEDKDKGTNYVNYTLRSREGKGCSYEDFKKFLEKELDKLESSEIKENIIKELKLEEFLPLQRTKDNSVVPYQVHKEELVKILDNATKYYDFFNKKDENGFTVKEKIIQLLEFRIPYYVGPLNSYHQAKENGFAWSVRYDNEENTAVTPWNFERVIDADASAEKFIRNLTNKCTYLKNEDVLPKHSLLYSEYELLNDLNKLRYDGNRLTVEARDAMVENLFKKQGKKVSAKVIEDFLKVNGFTDGRGKISGIDVTIKSDLKSYRDFKNILGEKFDTERVENIINWITLYGESKKLIINKINKVYGDYYTTEEIKKISRLTYKGWGRFSRKLLTEIVSEKFFNEETGECLNIINALRQNTMLLMEILANQYGYMEQIKDYNKRLQKEIFEITPDLLDDLYVSPAVKRSIWQTIRIVEELKKIIGSTPEKIFIETTRTNQAEKKRTNSRKDYLASLYKNIKDKEILELEKSLGTSLDFDKNKSKLMSVEPSELKAKKLYLYYMQLGRCMYSGERILLSELFDNNKYDIDHIYPQSKVKDDSFTNTVLVKREINEEKGNNYPLEKSIQDENKNFWLFLKNKDLISDEKYNRLVRTKDFSDDELTGFIARQLVETSQSVKAVANILQELNQKSVICYSKAENVSEFRENFGKIKSNNLESQSKEKLIKVREINDLHHAKDAYLNIVVGNVYDVKFTRNAYNFITKEKNGRQYSLNKIFYRNVKNSKTIAWEVDKTINTVESVMNNNSILVTRRTSEQKGGLYNENISKAKKSKDDSYYPQKTSDKRLIDVAKYGGFPKIKIAYYSIFECITKNKKGEEKITRIIPIPIYISQNIKNDSALTDYAKSQIKAKYAEEIKDLKLKYRKLCIGGLCKLNNFSYYVGGKTSEYFNFDSAIQVILDNNSEKYIKEIVKYLNWKKDNKDGELWKIITSEKNIKLYNTLVKKMNSNTLKNKKLNNYNELKSGKVFFKFKNLNKEEQITVLLELLYVLTEKKTTFNLKLINLTATRAKNRFDLTNLNQFSIIEKSITGFYEKEITIIGEKNNDMENNSN